MTKHALRIIKNYKTPQEVANEINEVKPDKMLAAPAYDNITLIFDLHQDGNLIEVKANFYDDGKIEIVLPPDQGKIEPADRREILDLISKIELEDEKIKID